MQPLRVSCLETVLSSFICTYVASFLVLPFVGVPVTHSHVMQAQNAWAPGAQVYEFNFSLDLDLD